MDMTCTALVLTVSRLIISMAEKLKEDNELVPHILQILHSGLPHATRDPDSCGQWSKTCFILASYIAVSLTISLQYSQT
jgi:murein endopeptidase